MTNFNSDDRPGEFELIAKLFAPLSRNASGAYGLTDDAATFLPPPGEEIVITADMLTEGVHFRAEDPPDRIARKALRSNLSDLAAKGARPHGYLLSLALPKRLSSQWLQTFAAGLNEDQNEFAVSLIGGDTTATDGPLTVAITAIGTLPSSSMLRRNGAKPGDLVFVTGTIGDAGAGLALLKNGTPAKIDGDRQTLIDRYQIPNPRLTFGRALRGIATASLDISDSLLADLGHIAETSGVGILVNANRVPLSDALKTVVGISRNAIADAVTAGDDYEVAFTAPTLAREALQRIARETDTPVTEIGRVESGSGVVLQDSASQEIAVSRKGYQHF